MSTISCVIGLKAVAAPSSMRTTLCSISQSTKVQSSAVPHHEGLMSVRSPGILINGA
jgi:hypothetical protein